MPRRLRGGTNSLAAGRLFSPSTPSYERDAHRGTRDARGREPPAICRAGDANRGTKRRARGRPPAICQSGGANRKRETYAGADRRQPVGQKASTAGRETYAGAGHRQSVGQEAPTANERSTRGWAIGNLSGGDTGRETERRWHMGERQSASKGVLREAGMVVGRTCRRPLGTRRRSGVRPRRETSRVR